PAATSPSSGDRATDRIGSPGFGKVACQAARSDSRWTDPSRPPTAARVRPTASASSPGSPLISFEPALLQLPRRNPCLASQATTVQPSTTAHTADPSGEYRGHRAGRAPRVPVGPGPNTRTPAP